MKNLPIFAILGAVAMLCIGAITTTPGGGGGGGAGISASTATNIANAAVSGANSNIAARTLPQYYVDSVNGNNSNTGTNRANAVQTIAGLTNRIGQYTVNNAMIFAARGSLWREQFNAGSNVWWEAYGDGELPTLNAANIATNALFAAFDAPTYTYAITVAGGGSVRTIQVIENGVQLIKSNTIAGVKLVPGTFFATNAPAAGSSQVVYIHPFGSTDPTGDGKAYEISVRDYGFFGGENVTIDGLVTKNQMCNNGSLEVGLRTHWRDVHAFNGTKHNALFGSGVVEDFEFRYANNHDDGSVPLVAFTDDAAGHSVIVRNGVIGGAEDRIIGGQGFLGHDNVGNNYKFALIDNVRVEFAQGFGSGIVATNGLQIWRNPVGYGLSRGGWDAYGGTNVFIDAVLLPSPKVPVASGSFVIHVRGSAPAHTWVAGARFSGTPYGIRAITNATVRILDSWIEGTGGDGLSGDNASGGGAAFSVSNSIIQGFGVPYNLAAGNTISGANSNVFSMPSSLVVNGTTHATWGAYQAANPSLDAGSVTNDLQAVGTAARGDFNYSTTSPAVTNQAGPGWGASRVPVIAKQYLAVTPAGLVAGPWLENYIRASTNYLDWFKLGRTNDINYLARNFGNITNTALTLVRYDALNNFDMYFNRNASSSENRLVFETAGTEVGYLGYEASGTRLKMQGAGIDAMAVNNMLNFYGGGAGQPGFAFIVNGTTNLFADATGDWGLGTNNPQARLHVDGSVILNNVGSNAAPVSYASFDADGLLQETAIPSGVGGDVTAAANIADTAVVVGDGGAKGVKQSGVIIGSTANVSGIQDLSANSATIANAATFSGPIIQQVQLIGNGAVDVSTAGTNGYRINTNASFALTFSGASVAGQVVSLSISNHSAGAIIVTNSLGIYYPPFGSNVTLFSLRAGQTHWLLKTNATEARWEIISELGPQYELAATGNNSATTNGNTVSILGSVAPSFSTTVLTNNTTYKNALEFPTGQLTNHWFDMAYATRQINATNNIHFNALTNRPTPPDVKASTYLIATWGAVAPVLSFNTNVISIGTTNYIQLRSNTVNVVSIVDNGSNGIAGVTVQILP